MGRDFYDAIFLLEKTKPNIEFLKLKLDIKDSMDLKNKIPLQYDINNYLNIYVNFSFFPLAYGILFEKIILFYYHISLIIY